MLSRLGIHDFRKVGVLPDVQAVLLEALKADAGAVHFGEAVGIVHLDIEELLDALAESLGVGLGADHGDAQGELAGILAHLTQAFAQDERVGRQNVGHCGVEVPDQLDLAQGVAGAGGNGHAAEALRAGMDAESAGEEAVAGHILKDIILAHAHHVQAAGHEVGPDIQIILGVGDSHGRARGAARAVQAHQLVAGNDDQSERILGAEIVLRSHGDLLDVIEGFDAVRSDAGLVKALPVELAPFVHAGHHVLQARELRRLNLIPAPEFFLIVRIVLHQCPLLAISAAAHAGDLGGDEERPSRYGRNVSSLSPGG